MNSHTIKHRNRKTFFNSLSINTYIILLNVLLFFVFIILIKQNFLTWDDVAIKPSNIIYGGYIWTFLTSMFMHGGFFHLFVNMFSLFFIGSLLQRILGQKRYFYFYLIAGIFAGLFFVFASFIMNGFGYGNDYTTFAVGSSGAIFGLIGLLMLLTPNLPVYVMFIPIPIKIKYAGIGILVLLWIISITGNVPIGNTAHLGGLIAGLIYGVYLRQKYQNKIKAISKHFS